jgi:hypothetical protein
MTHERDREQGAARVAAPPVTPGDEQDAPSTGWSRLTLPQVVRLLLLAIQRQDIITKVKRARETLNQIKTQAERLGAGGGAAHGLRAGVVDVG